MFQQPQGKIHMMEFNQEIIDRSFDRRERGSQLLKQADAYVKRENFASALEAIRHAKIADPSNPYCLAYEERVRTLMKTKQEQTELQAGIARERVRQYLHKAEHHMSRRMLGDALEEVSHAYMVSPRDPEVERMRDQILVALKEDQNQQRAFRISAAKAQQLNPRAPIDF
jgi:tetratricopeptide (TPR) repeat protein